MTLKRVNINNMQSRGVTADTHQGNVVAGIGNVTVFVGTDVTPLLPVPKHYHGEVAGYTLGGEDGNPYHTPNYSTVIDKFPFTSDASATDVGDLTQPVSRHSSASSSSHGYRAGGEAAPTPVSYSNVIDKVPFAADTNASDVGDLTKALISTAGVYSTTHGYVLGGRYPNTDDIQKYSFASNGNAVFIAELTSFKNQHAGTPSSSAGYTIGGYHGPSNVNVPVNKISFSSDTDATSIGTLGSSHAYQFYLAQANSSETHLYAVGGTPSASDSITKFPFSSTSPATDVGELFNPFAGGAAQNSATHGYTSGDIHGGKTNTIQKYSFLSDSPATDVGEITVARGYTAGAQA